MTKWEIKKLFKNKSLIISSIIILLLCGVMSICKPELEVERSYINENGKYVEDNRDTDIIANEKLLSKVEQIKELKLQGNGKNVDASTKEISKISSEKLKKDEGKEYKDISFYQVFNYRASNFLVGFIISGIIVYIFSNIYTDEKLSNADSIILSSKNKNNALLSKLYLSIILPILIYFVYLIIIGGITAMQYGLPQNGELQAYRIVQSFIMLKAININTYTMLNIATMTIIFVSIGVFSSLFSFITRNSVESIVCITTFIIIGKLLTIIKFLPKELLIVSGYSNYIDIFMTPQILIGNYLGIINIFGTTVSISNLVYVVLLGVVIIGIILNIYVFKKILSK